MATHRNELDRFEPDDPNSAFIRIDDVDVNSIDDVRSLVSHKRYRRNVENVRKILLKDLDIERIDPNTAEGFEIISLLGQGETKNVKSRMHIPAEYIAYWRSKIDPNKLDPNSQSGIDHIQTLLFYEVLLPVMVFEFSDRIDIDNLDPNSELGLEWICRLYELSALSPNQLKRLSGNVDCELIDPNVSAGFSLINKIERANLLNDDLAEKIANKIDPQIFDLYYEVREDFRDKNIYKMNLVNSDLLRPDHIPVLIERILNATLEELFGDLKLHINPFEAKYQYLSNTVGPLIDRGILKDNEVEKILTFCLSDLITSAHLVERLMKKGLVSSFRESEIRETASNIGSVEAAGYFLAFKKYLDSTHPS